MFMKSDDVNICKGGSAMTVPMNQLGICSTCNHMKECTIRKNWKGPVTFCEEFDDYVPPREVPAPKEMKEESDTPHTESDTGKYKGLCVNCDLRKTCAFPKPEGGVWHCEEYE